MSEENVERMRQAVAAFGRGDKETWLAFCHRDIEIVPMGRLAGGTHPWTRSGLGLCGGRRGAVGAGSI